MSIKSMSEGMYKFVRNSMDDIHDYAVKNAPKVYNKVVKPIGKAGFDIGMKGTAKTLETTANTVDHFRRNKDTYKRIGKSMLNTADNIAMGTAREAGIWAQAGANVLGGIKKMGLIERTTLDKSAIGWRFTKRGKLALTAGALAVGSVGATKDYTESRIGRNDGQLYRPTPTMSNAYDLSSQMAHSSIGQSYANNAGATGDLVFALNNLRNG